MNIEIKDFVALEQITINNIIDYYKTNLNKFLLLEIFSSSELAVYMTENKLIDEELVSLLVEENKINLETLLGKIATKRFNQTVNNVIVDVVSKNKI